MHERSLVAALLEQVASRMQDHDATGVVVVQVAIGEFCGVEPELFRLAYEEMVGQSPARGARLESRVVALRAECEDCGVTYRPEQFRFACPACGGRGARVVEGEALILERLELEVA